jgi:hypothetical protein
MKQITDKLANLRGNLDDAYAQARPTIEQAADGAKVVLQAMFGAIAHLDHGQRALVLAALRKALGGVSVASLAKSTLSSRLVVVAVAGPLLVVEAGRFRAELAQLLTSLDGAPQDKITAAVLAKVVEFLVAVGITTMPAIGALVLGRRTA